MDIIILLGAPGAGKGTVAERVKKETGFLHVSTGDMLRAAIDAESGTGRQAQEFMQRGELVPDELILKIIRERIAQEPRETRFLFDGFPRTLPQAEGLDSLIRELKACFLGAFLLEVPQELLIRRLTGRRVCRDCGAVYHILYSPPQTEGVCDQCGGTDLYQRADDSKETILNRLKVFDRQTRPVIEYYREQSRLFAVDASDDPEAIFRRFSAVLKDASR